MQNLTNADTLTLFRSNGACPAALEWIASHGGDLKSLIMDCPDDTWIWWALIKLDAVTLREFHLVQSESNRLARQYDCELLNTPPAEWKGTPTKEYMVGLRTFIVSLFFTE